MNRIFLGIQPGIQFEKLETNNSDCTLQPCVTHSLYRFTYFRSTLNIGLFLIQNPKFLLTSCTGPGIKTLLNTSKKIERSDGSHWEGDLDEREQPLHNDSYFIGTQLSAAFPINGSTWVSGGIAWDYVFSTREYNPDFSRLPLRKHIFGISASIIHRLTGNR
ncbi:MAG: hypothetical protein JW861_03080 [Bacteroidales bacterium]|nr:hypothetical protein [Bacteroidales bacterium]